MMKHDKTPMPKNRISMEDKIPCAGHYNPTDPICHDMCALRMRCAIESHLAAETEIFEEIFGPEMFDDRVQ